MNLRKGILAALLLALVAASLYVISPMAYALYWAHKVNRSVKIRADYPGCAPGPNAWDAQRCQCEFVFDGERRPENVFFEGDFKKSYDASTRTFTLTGAGKIRDQGNEIVIAGDHIAINHEVLPADRYSFHVLITPTGELKNSRVDIAW